MDDRDGVLPRHQKRVRNPGFGHIFYAYGADGFRNMYFVLDTPFARLHSLLLLKPILEQFLSFTLLISVHLVTGTLQLERGADGALLP